MGWTSSITMPWWGSWVARWLQTKKCDAFFIIFVTFWIYEVCDNGNATKQCNFQNNYGTVEYRMVSSLLYFVLGLLIMMCDLTCDRRSSKFLLGLFITICTIRKPLAAITCQSSIVAVNLLSFPRCNDLLFQNLRFFAVFTHISLV